MNLISVRGLSHRFLSGAYGIKQVDIDIREDEFLLITGKNGSGKTLLMLHIVGLYEPTSGEVLYRDEPISSRIELVRSRVGIVFQNPESQFLGQTVAEDVGFGLEYSGLSDSEIDARVHRSMDKMSISHLADRQPLRLSGGEQRKAALAALLAREPEVLILDEPFIGLDLPGVRSIIESIDSLRKEGHAIVIITHDVEKILAHCDRVAVMDGGRVAEIGSPESVITHFAKYEIRSPDLPVSSMSWLRT